jgi:hypothetical protein
MAGAVLRPFDKATIIASSKVEHQHLCDASADEEN